MKREIATPEPICPNCVVSHAQQFTGKIPYYVISCHTHQNTSSSENPVHRSFRLAIEGVTQQNAAFFALAFKSLIQV